MCFIISIANTFILFIGLTTFLRLLLTFKNRHLYIYFFTFALPFQSPHFFFCIAALRICISASKFTSLYFYVLMS